MYGKMYVQKKTNYVEPIGLFGRVPFMHKVMCAHNHIIPLSLVSVESWLVNNCIIFGQFDLCASRPSFRPCQPLVFIIRGFILCLKFRTSPSSVHVHLSILKILSIWNSLRLQPLKLQHFWITICPCNTIFYVKCYGHSSYKLVIDSGLLLL